MKTFMNVSIPVILTFSLVLLLNTGSSNIYGQIIEDTNQANQTSGQNTTQQLEQANQQLAQANQTQQQVSNETQQQLAQANQTSGQNTTQQAGQQQLAQANQTQQQVPELDEKLLNYTNAAILALNDEDIGAAQDNPVQIQNELINAGGKQVVIIPAPAVAPSSSDDDDGDSG